MGYHINQNSSKEKENITFDIAPAMVTASLSSKQEVNAKSIQKSRIISTNGECSCCLFTSTASQKKSWVNYCPECHKHGKLIFERTGDCPEGMIRCTSCDADYCAVHGKEHINRGADYLIPA